MGNIKKVLGASVDPGRLCAKRLAVDFAENIHLHHRDVRLEMSKDEWVNLLGITEDADDVYGKLYRDEIFTDHKQCRRDTTPTSTYGGGETDNPDRIQVELQENGTVHLHYHDFRIEMTTEKFLRFGQLIKQSCQQLLESKCSKDHIKRTADRYERQDIIQVNLSDLLVNVWQAGNGCMPLPICESPIYIATLNRHGEFQAGLIYDEYIARIDKAHGGKGHWSHDYAYLEDMIVWCRSLQDGLDCENFIQVVEYDIAKRQFLVIDGHHRAAIFMWLCRKNATIPVILCGEKSK